MILSFPYQVVTEGRWLILGIDLIMLPATLLTFVAVVAIAYLRGKEAGRRES